MAAGNAGTPLSGAELTVGDLLAHAQTAINGGLAWGAQVNPDLAVYAGSRTHPRPVLGVDVFFWRGRFRLVLLTDAPDGEAQQ